MPVQADRTRTYWQTLEPDKFIGAVLYGPLRAHINNLHTRISLYTGILHRSMNGSILRLSAPPTGGPASVVRVRDLFKHMRACMADANDIISGDSATMQLPDETYEDYILRTVYDLRRYLSNVERWSNCLLSDPLANSMSLPELNNGYVAHISHELLELLQPIYALLEFAVQYVEQAVARRLHGVKV